MSTLAEIEFAVDSLSAAEQEVLLEHLAARLRRTPTVTAEHKAVAPEAIVWPDYEARLRAIYGDKVMPSMVLAERETAPW